MSQILKIFIIMQMCFIALVDAQTRNNFVPGAVRIKVKPGMYVNETDVMSVSNIASDRLRYCLMNFGCRSISKIFIGSRLADTLAHDMYGNPVILNDLSGWIDLQFDTSIADDRIIDSLRSIPGILRVEKIKLINVINDGFSSEISTQDKQRKQWALFNPDNRNPDGSGHDINATVAWDFQKGRDDVVVAVVDDGVQHDHPDLDISGIRSRVIAGRYFRVYYCPWPFKCTEEDDNSDPTGTNDHGTKIAGVIGAITDNTPNSIAGVMWNCKIMPIRVLPTGIPDGIAKGIDWARQSGAHIFNLSFETGGEDEMIIKEAIGNAYLQGRIVCAAMGNVYNTYTTFPAAYFGVIAVGGTDKLDNRWFDPVTGSGSSAGNHISVSAPAEKYRTTTIGGQYTDDQHLFGGTSLATPLVSGSAGLILSQSLDRGLNLTNDDVKHLLERTADDQGSTGWDTEYGYGRINVGNAIKKLSPPYEVQHAVLTNGNRQLQQDDLTLAILPQYYPPQLNQDYYGESSRHKVSWHVTFAAPYAETPLVWVRERETRGWEPSNPNFGIPYARIYNLNANGFDVETYIYFIGGGLGGSVQKWWPGDTDDPQSWVAYTVVGRRIITSPTSLTSVFTTTQQIRLSWQDQSNNEVSFQVERSTDGTNYSVIGEVTTNGNGSGTRTFDDPNILQDVTYYYRVRGSAQEFVSSYSNTSTITIPTLVAVSQNLPVNGATNVHLQPTLTWYLTPGAQSYHVQVDNQNPPQAPFIFENSNVTAISVQTNGLGYSTPYYWQVKAKNAFGDGPWSSVRSFTTSIPPPATPQNFDVTPTSNGCSIDPPEGPEFFGGEESFIGGEQSSLDGGGGGCDLTKLTWDLCPGTGNSIEIARGTSSNDLRYYASVSYSSTCYTDNVCFVGLTVYYYKIRAVNDGGYSAWSPIFSNGATKIGVKNNEGKNITSGFILKQNIPNPFNPVTIINYELPSDCYVTLKVYNTLGKEVSTLVEMVQDAGNRSVTFDATLLQSSVYFYRIIAVPLTGSREIYTATKKMLIAK
ncbi:MAG: S8 family serine peptidase [Ignavibacteriae bacterium]|nr:S8 family serine peptidase [Ignavibacteriota bacterium]